MPDLLRDLARAKAMFQLRAVMAVIGDREMNETDAPERIWLQDDGDYAKAQMAGADLTWCEDRISDNDTEYVRADLYAVLEDKLAQAVKTLNNIASDIAVPAGTSHRGINFKELYKGWRKEATTRADLAYATLATLTGDKIDD